MFKVLIVAAVCCCVLAIEGQVYPKQLDIAFHYTVNDSESGVEDCYAVVLNDYFLYINCSKEGSSTLTRCDIGQNGYCFSKTVGNGDPVCIDNARPEVTEFFPLDIDFTQGPIPATCPDGSDGCLNFTGETSSVTLDSQNRVVYYARPKHWGYPELRTSTITFHNDVPTSDMFDGTDCNGNALPAVLSYNTFYPKELDCAFHFTVNDSNHNPEYQGIRNGDDIMYLKTTAMDSQIFYQLYRCEGDVYHCYSEEYTSRCENRGQKNPNFLFVEQFPRKIDYIGEPATISCTEGGSDKCTKYTSFNGYSYIVDSDKRLVKTIFGDRVTEYIYHNDHPSAKMFDRDMKCNTTAFPPAVNFCGDDSSSTTPTSSGTTRSSSATQTSTSVASVNSVSFAVVSIIVSVILLL